MRFTLILILLTIYSCTEYSVKTDYNLINNVEYGNHNDFINQDSLYLFFETGFINDYAVIEYENNKIKIGSLTTDESIGLANFIVIPIYNKIAVSVSGGPKLFIDYKKSKTNIWGIFFYSDTLHAKGYKNAPAYY